MLLEHLKVYAEEALINPNYQHKSLSATQRFEIAKTSFLRLPPDQIKKVEESWAAYLGKAKLEDADRIQLMNFRLLAQTNLFFLCKILEKYSQVTLGTHEEICNKFFVSKDPTCNRFETFANNYGKVEGNLKDRMLLVPRGGFKSSIDIADCVQWIINYPEVTILILTGVYGLASDFVGELRYHFTLAENGILDKEGKVGYGPKLVQNPDTGDWSSSIFQVLFAEHCVKGEGKATEFQTPAGGDDKEPTVRAAGIEQVLSGWHFGIMKLDDVVTNENSLTITRLAAVNRQISINRAMLHPYGFMDVIGTWYDDKDYYGISIKHEENMAKEVGSLGLSSGSVESGRFDSWVTMKVYLRAAWWPTKEAKAAGKIEEEMTEKDWDLWFPERLNYKFLNRENKKDPEGFAIKYLNNPRQIHKVKFPRELMLRRTVPHQQLPQTGIIVQSVDTAYSIKSWADYTVIITALISEGRFYIIHMKRGKYNEYELPAVIAANAYRWKPVRIVIEDSVGVKWMGRELRREMDKLEITIPVEYVSLGLGTKAKSKQIKAKPVLRRLGDERLFFTLSCEGLEEIYTELEQFTGTSDDTHDDIVSALSILVDQFGSYADYNKMTNINAEYAADRQSKEKHDLIYGLGKYRSLNSNFALEDNPVTIYQVENSKQSEIIADHDPLSDLF